MCYNGHMLQDQLTTVICQVLPDLWFSESESKKSIARDLCSDCWFKEDCLQRAIDNSEVHGIWGGVDFSNPLERISSTIKKCRNGHELPPEGGNCYTCRRISQKKYDKKIKKNYNKTKPRKNILGGYCLNDHLLSEDNVTIRSSDQAVLCKKCYSSNKLPHVKAYSLPGDFS